MIGLIHVMIGKHEGERGNMKTYRERLYQGKCWVSWSIVIGTLFTTVYVSLPLLLPRFDFQTINVSPNDIVMN